MNQDDIVVRETELGFGVIAFEEFARCAIIGEIAGNIHDDANYESDYCMDLGGNARLDPQGPFRYLNHSCEPNCELILWKTRWQDDKSYARVWLQTLESVSPGEELTIDYAWPVEQAIPCRCRSRHCRGWIVDAAEVGNLNSWRATGLATTKHAPGAP